MQLQAPFGVITPTLDGRVLAVLALVDTSFTSGQLSPLVSASLEGTRKVLTRLSAQGIVSSDRHGSVTSYRLNRDHLAADAITTIARLRTIFLRRLKAELSTWSPPPEYVAVFGSAASGDMTASSDIDIFVVRPDEVDEAAWESQSFELSQLVTRWTGNDTRLLQYSRSELWDEIDEPVFNDVAADGLTVFGSRAWLTRQLRQER